MANILNDALKFGKGLPGCLNAVPLQSNYTSMHNNGGKYSAISVTLYKAFRQFALITENQNVKSGVGTVQDKSLIAEIYHEDTGMTDVCVVKRSGAVYAGTHDGSVMNRFTIGRNQRGGTVLFLALMKKILTDKEAKETFDRIKKDLIRDPENSSLTEYESSFTDNLAILCDNVYQRIIKQGTSCDIVLGSIPANGALKALTSAMLSAPTMKVAESQGQFHLFAGVQENTGKKQGNYTAESFRGAFQFSNRELSEEEKKMVPEINKDWIIPYEAEKICKHIKKTTGLYEPSRTFYLEGLAGSGKTSIASIVAAGVNLPKVVYTCHTGTEMIDILGQVMPGKAPNKDFFTILKEYRYPSIEDIQFDLEGSYKLLTGEELPLGMDEAGCISILIDKVMSKAAGNEFHFVESDIIKAIKYGWVCEIQEPACVLQQGVLVGLNSLLEPNGVITLPTGEQIRRHPDTIIIFTANPSSYKGCETLNQSVISRANMKLTIESSDTLSMAKKAMAVTGFGDLRIAKEMADIVNRISRYLIENEIDDGVCGQRELKDWMQSVIVEGEEEIFNTALDTIIGKCTEDQDERENIIDGFLRTSSFA